MRKRAITKVHGGASRVRTLAVALVTMLALAACGGPSASITLVVSPDTVVVFLGADVDVKLTLTRSADATAAVTLSATGAPAWVTVAFSPAALSGGTLSSTMTVSTDAGHPDAAPQTFTLNVSAAGAGLSATAQVEVEVEQLNVTGTVVDASGAPLAGMTVYTPGHTAALSDGDGTFSFESVSAPYDLTVADSLSGIVQTFVGLTSATPRVLPLSSSLASLTEHSAVVSGSLTHATLVPIPDGHRARICVEGIDQQVLNSCAIVPETFSSYAVTSQWSGEASHSVRVRVVVFQVDAFGEPTNIVASGTSGTFTLGNGDNSVQDVTVTNTASQATVSTTATVPAGYTLTGRQLVAHYTDVASIGLANAVGETLTRNVIAPFFADIDYSLFVTAGSNVPSSSSASIAWSAGHASGDSVALTLPRPAVQVAPPDAATGVNSQTEFTVVNPDGGVATFLIQPAASGTTYAITTVATTASIPNLATIGLALPTATAYTWLVLTRHDVTTMEAAVTGDGYIGQFTLLSDASSGGGPGPETGGLISTSETRTFTTQ